MYGSHTHARASSIFSHVVGRPRQRFPPPAPTHDRYLFVLPSRTTLLLRVAVPENSGALPGGRPAVNVTLFPTTRGATGGAGGDDDTPHAPPPEATGAGGAHHHQGRITLDPRSKPTSSSVLATSNGGVYMDSSAGAVTEKVEVEAGEYVAVVSSFSPQEADFVLTVYSSPALARVQRMVG